MGNPWGTAMQVLAGAFGQGASSLGKSRMDQARIDEENRRDDEDMLFDRTDRATRDTIARTDRLEQRGYDRRQDVLDRNDEALEISYLRGLTPTQKFRLTAIMKANPTMSEDEARTWLFTNEDEVRGTPFQAPPSKPQLPTRFPSSRPPGAAPARPRRRPPPNVP